MSNRAKRRLTRLGTLHLPLLLFLLFTLFPFYWALNTSFKFEKDIIKLPLKYLPDPFTLENYSFIWGSLGFSRYFFNSIVSSVITTVTIIFVALLGGYALSRYQFKGKGIVMLLLLLTQMLPAIILVIPLFKIYMGMGLINTITSLVLTYTTTQIPFCLIMMSGFFTNIPKTMEEAGMIDGCSLLGAIFRIVLPAVAPGVVAVGAFAFVGAWNDFVYALNFINLNEKFTIPVGLQLMKGEFAIEYGSLAAGSIIALVPVLCLFAYIQKYLVKGLAAGAVKG